VSVATLQAHLIDSSSQKDDLLQDSLDLLGEEINNNEVKGFAFDRASNLLTSFIKHNYHLDFAAKLFGGKDYGEEALG